LVLESHKRICAAKSILIPLCILFVAKSLKLERRLRKLINLIPRQFKLIEPHSCFPS